NFSRKPYAHHFHLLSYSSRRPSLPGSDRRRPRRLLVLVPPLPLFLANCTNFPLHCCRNTKFIAVDY
ncbi:hypothetical protein Csa_009001, partial [Cucumis sativus]